MPNWFQHLQNGRIVWVAGLLIGGTAGAVAGWFIGG